MKVTISFKGDLAKTGSSTHSYRPTVTHRDKVSSTKIKQINSRCIDLKRPISVTGKKNQ